MAYGVSLFLSAALLFTLQPMVGKMLLPLFGGTASVWNVCLVAFQTLYLLGCVWVFFITRWLSPMARVFAHLGVLLLAGLTLPPTRLLTLASQVPTDGNPLPWLMKSLLFFVGPLLLVLSSTSSLVQSWYGQSDGKRANDPYYLSQVGNAGSLAALLAYPFLLEAHWGLADQARSWTFCYLVFFVATAYCGFQSRHSQPQSEVTASPLASPTWSRRWLWLGISFVPSSLLSGSTFYLSELISVMPLLWILPLALYLISLIVAFSDGGPRVATRFRYLSLLAAAVWLLSAWESILAFWLVLSLHLTAFFLVSTVLHCELARLRPAVKWLPEFYLWMAAGGALGGAFNALVAPLVFSRAVEYPLMIAAAGFLLAYCLSLPRWTVVAASVALPVIFLVRFGERPDRPNRIFFERNFYGITKVFEEPDKSRLLFHNAYMQSKQSGHPLGRRQPYANLGRTSAIGRYFTLTDATTPAPNVAVIGMGAGVLATYARPGSHWVFYELNPSIVKAVHEQKLFTYLQDSAAKTTEVILGDARKSLEKAPDRSFDLVVIDAFNSTSLPAHLITKEAFELYFRKATERGVVALNNISLIFDLAGIARRISSDKGWFCVTGAEEEWIFVSRDPEALRGLTAMADFKVVPASDRVRAWTDEFSNPSGVILWPRFRRAQQWLRAIAGN